MNKHYRLFALFAIIMIVVFSLKLNYEYKMSQKIKEHSIKYEAQSIANFLVAIRDTYQDIFIKNHTKLDKSTIDFLPVKTSNEIAKVFSSLGTKSKISIVSNRPRNPENMANARQLEVINLFLKDKTRKSYFKTIGNRYYYSQPLIIGNRCIKCHGKKENASKIIRDNYDLAYDYKLGDLRGIIDIELSQTKLSLLLNESGDTKVYFVLALLSLILGITFIYVTYNIKLSKLLLKASLALEETNHTLEDRVKEEIDKNRAKDQKLFQQSRLAQMGEMLSMIAHQWRQPLSSISATVSNLEMKIEMDKYDLQTKEGADACKTFLGTKLHNINNYVQTLSSTIDDFRNFYNPHKEKKLTNINEPIIKALDIIKLSIITQGIEVVESYESKHTLSLAEGELMQVFLNILKNAQDNFKEKKSTSALISISTCDIDKGVQVEIADNGGGENLKI